jgi:hypothetical protein
MRDILAINDDLPSIRPDKPDQVLEKCALAAPASPEDDKDLSFVNLKGDAFQNRFLSVPRDKVFHLNDRLPVHH